MEGIQKITWSMLFNSTVKQFFNTFENKDLMEYLLSNELEKIEKLLENDDIEGARAEIDSIFTTKESLPEEIELKLKFLKGNIEIELKNYKSVKLIIEQLNKSELGKKNAIDLNFKYAMKINDEELMERCIEKFKEQGESEANLLARKLTFYFNNGDIFKSLDYVKDINDNKIEDKSIFHYISVAYLNKHDYKNSRVFAEKAIKLGAGDVSKYIIILTEVNPIIERRGTLITISDDEKSLLLKKADELKLLIETLPKEIEVEIVSIIVNIFLIVDLERAKVYLNAKEDLLLKSMSGKLLKANIDELSGNYEVAKLIYLELLEEKWVEELLVHLALCMSMTKDYKEYIAIFDKYSEMIEDKSFILTDFYLLSIKNVYGKDKMMDVLEEIKYKHTSSIRFNIFMSNNTEDITTKYKLLKESEKLLDDSNELDREALKFEYWNIEKFQDAIRVIEPILNYKEILISTIKMVLSKNKKEFYLNLIIEIDKYKDVELMKYKVEMLYHINEFEEAKKVMVDIYIVEKNIDNLRRLIDLKLELEDSSGLEPLLIELLSSKTALDYIKVAIGYLILGDTDKYNSFSYEAIFMTGGLIDVQAYKLLVGYNFRVAMDGKEKNIEIDKVIDNTVVVLNSNGILMNVCLNSEEKYQTNEEICGCIHIKRNDLLWTDLIHEKVGSKIQVNGISYIIDSIIDKNIVFSQYCFSELEKSGNHIGRAVTIEEFPELMREIGQMDEESYKQKFSMYNFEEGSIGLPFSKVIYGSDLKRSVQILNILINNSKYSFYIGINEKKFESDKIVLTYQTLLLLEHYDMLDIINKDINKYNICNSLKEVLLDTLIEGKRNVEQLFVGYDSITDTIYKQNRNYDEILCKFRNIINVINNIATHEVKYEVRDSLINICRSFLADIDVDTIYLAKKLNANLIIDDLFIRKLIQSNEFTNKINNSNVVYFLDKLLCDNPAKYYNTIKQMVEDKIKYIIDKDIFINILINYKYNGFDIEWFKSLVSDMTKDGDDYYKQIILTAGREVWEEKSISHIREEIIFIVCHLNLVNH